MAAAAAGEVIGEALGGVGMNPELVLVFAAGTHGDFVGELASTVNQVLRPRTTVTMVVAGLHSNGVDLAGDPGLLLWATTAGPVVAHVLDEAGLGSDGRPPDFGASPSAILFLANVAQWPSPDHLGRWSQDFPMTFITGVSPTEHPGEVLVGGRPIAAGGVALVFNANAPVFGRCVSRTRAVGPVMTATEVRGRAIVELDDIRALRRFEQVVTDLAETDRRDLRRSVLAGINAPDGGEFFASQVLGTDRRVGSLVLEHEIAVGTIVQLRVMSDDAAATSLLDAFYGQSEHPVVGALTFADGLPSRRDGFDSAALAETLDEWRDALGSGVYSGRVIGSLGGHPRIHHHMLSALIVRAPGKTQSKT